MAEKLKLCIVDDHKLFRSGLRLILQEMPEVEAVYDVEDGKQFIDLLHKESFDLVLMDINMPVMDGVEATRQALIYQPSLPVLVLSMHTETAYYEKMVELGVKGFLLKNAGAGELENAVRIVASGGTYFSQELLLNVIQENRATQDDDVAVLSPREQEVLQLLAAGMSNVEIAENLFISQRTVDRHRANLLDKTACKNAVCLVVYAVKHGLVEI